MDIDSKCLVRIGIIFVSTTGWFANAVQARTDDTSAIKSLLRTANGGVAHLQAGKVYGIREKIELSSLCPRGVTIEGNNATIKGLPGFRHNVLFTATKLLRDAPYAPGVTVRNLTIDGNGQVGRCVFGNWKNARIDNLLVRGGTIYQVNAIWHDSTLSDIQIIGNANQTDNGFDCNLQNSTIWNIDVNMHGNLKESAFWLNGSNNATVINPSLTDGRSAFGLENCKDVNVINPRIRGQFSFRVVNILPAKISERIYLYDVDLDTVHIGKDASAGVHFNATKGGMVVRGKIRISGPGILLTHGASDIDVIRVALPSRPVYPVSDWSRLRNPSVWMSKRRKTRNQWVNKAPVVNAGPDSVARYLKNVMLRAAVADEHDLNQLTVAWSKVSGPGHVAFSHATHPHTKVKFSRPGTYTLLLTASDGEFQSKDEVTLAVGLTQRMRGRSR